HAAADTDGRARPPRRSTPVFCGTPASVIPGFALLWTTWCRHVVPAAVVATRFARERMDRQTLTRGCRQMMERKRGSLQIRSPTEATPCSTQPRQPLAIGVGRRFLIFRYQTAPGCVVPADRVA